LDITPLHYADRFGCWLKLENLQRTGSYKVRGALNALLAARERGDDRPVMAASAGNHAQGLAWAGQRLNVSVVAVMPQTAPTTKVAGVERLGAKVILHGKNFDEAKDFAEELALELGYRFLPAFDDPDVIAGQGTIGLELQSLRPDVVLVPIGGGGLAAGVALALRSTRARVVGVQVEGVDAMARALRGETGLENVPATLADGIRVQEAGQLTRHLLGEMLDDLILVKESDVRDAVVRLATEERVIAEGAGALALAAASRVNGRRKCAIVSGGNIDARVLADLLSGARRHPDQSRKVAAVARVSTRPARPIAVPFLGA
jgi:threonine dehydratase